jgi:hypothetical protein
MVWTIDDYKGYSYRCVYNVSCIGAEKNESKNNIRNLKRGLERTRVIEIKIDDIDFEYYCIYVKSCKIRGASIKFTELQFINHLRKCFFMKNQAIYSAYCDNKLAAFMIVIYSETVAFGDVLYYDNSYSSKNPLWSLYYNIANMTLDKGFIEFDRGSQPLVHETNIDEFLLKINFKKIPITYQTVSLPFARTAFSFMIVVLKRFPKIVPKSLTRKVFALDFILDACKQECNFD